MTDRVLVLCTANRIRSVLFTALLDRYLATSGWSAHVVVSSAGLLEAGAPPAREAFTAAARFGFDLSGHRSRRLDRDLIDASHLILGAERNHVAEVWALRHEALTRTFTYVEFAQLLSVSAPRTQDEDLHAFVERVRGGSGRDVRTVMAAPDSWDVTDPVGRPTPTVLAVAAELDRLATGIGAATWPAA